MITELFDYFRIRAPKAVRNLGYVYSSIALEKRARRQKMDWSEHIKNCHELWAEVLKDQYFTKIAILGNGPLTEAPVELILAHCDELHLVDVVQPLKVKKRWGKHPKLYLHETDLTGVVDWLGGSKKAPDTLGFHAPVSQLKVDLVVSANLISQLSLEPSWYLTKKFGVAEESLMMRELISKIQTEHLEHLKTYGARRIIIYTDLERTYLSPEGKVLEKHLSRVPQEADMGKRIKSWNWRLCPLGEESDDFEIQMRVGAFEMASST